MNLWGRPGTALILALLVLASCEEDTYLLGFPKPDPNFNVSFKEFNVPTSVFLADSVPTHNFAAAGETLRLLCGQYNDGNFGTTTATAFTQFQPTDFPTIDPTATYDHLVLTIIPDFYYYGDGSNSEQTFQVLELTDSLVNYAAYFGNSPVSYSPTVLGFTTKIVDPVIFDQYLADNSDDIQGNEKSDSLTFELSASFGQALFDAAKDTSAAGVQQYQIFSRFRRWFKGFAIIPTNADKIIGFNMEHTKTRLTLYYKADTIRTLSYSLRAAAGVKGFTGFQADRSGTAISGLTSFYSEIQPSNDYMYVQAGTGVVTKLDFTEVYEFFEDVPIAALNAAELTFEAAETIKPPLRLALRGLRADNRNGKALSNTQNQVGDTLLILDYSFEGKHRVRLNDDGSYHMLGDDNELMLINRMDDPNVYKGFMTSFFQKEFSIEDGTFLKSFALITQTPSSGKAVNGLFFHKNSIKLKIFYTTPIQPE